MRNKASPVSAGSPEASSPAARPRKPQKENLARRKITRIGSKAAPYIFIAPNFLGFAAFTLLPVLFSVFLSFTEWKAVGTPEWIGLENFSELTRDANFLAALRNTAVYTVLTVPLTVVASLSLAMLLNTKIFARNFFRSLSFLPYISSVVAMAAVWRVFFSTAFGPLNKTMLDVCNWLGGLLGNQAMIEATLKDMPQWGRDFWPVMIFSVLFTVWKNMGYYMVIFLAGLQGVNRDLHESAAIDGANKWQRFRYITMSQLAPTTSFVMIMVTISSFKAYDIFINLFGGNDGTLSKNTYVIVQQILWTSFRGSLRYGYASAMAMVLFVIVLIVTFFQFRVTKNYSVD